MSTLLLEQSPALDEGFEQETRRRLGGASLTGTSDGAHGRLTLDDLITGVWEGLAVRDTVGCPVCAGPMTSRPSVATDGSHTGVCRDCGTMLD